MRESSFLILGAIIALSGCRDTADLSSPPLPLQMTIVSGDGQIADVGNELPEPLVVRVTDGRRGVSGQIVNWVPVSTTNIADALTGHVYAGSSVTNKDGIAKERWTLGFLTRDNQRIEARAVDNNTGAAMLYASFHAVRRALPASTMERCGLGFGTCPYGPEFQPATLGVPVQFPPGLIIGDRYNNPAPGTPVEFVSVAGESILIGATTTTGSTSAGPHVAALAGWIPTVFATLTNGCGYVTIEARSPGLTPVRWTASECVTHPYTPPMGPFGPF